MDDIQEEDPRAQWRARAVGVCHVALFAGLIGLTAASLGRARADDPGSVVLRLPWSAAATP
jgi:hypothetical protein